MRYFNHTPDSIIEQLVVLEIFIDDSKGLFPTIFMGIGAWNADIVNCYVVNICLFANQHYGTRFSLTVSNQGFESAISSFFAMCQPPSLKFGKVLSFFHVQTTFQLDFISFRDIVIFLLGSLKIQVGKKNYKSKTCTENFDFLHFLFFIILLLTVYRLAFGGGTKLTPSCQQYILFIYNWS